jgi:hypothetical protein
MPVLDTYALDNYSIDGSSSGILRAKGSVVAGPNIISFESTNGPANLYPAVVNGLAFRPNVILLQRSSDQRDVTTYNRNPANRQPTPGGLYYNTASIQNMSYTNFVWVYLFETQAAASSSGRAGYISNNTFFLPVTASTTYDWEALFIPDN